MYYFLGQAYEYLGQVEKARDAYRDALKSEDGLENWRWRSLQYIELMVKIAKTHSIPLVNTLPLFASRELTDNPEGLFADKYHAGPLGHQLIADELYRVITETIWHDFKTAQPSHAPRSGVRHAPM